MHAIKAKIEKMREEKGLSKAALSRAAGLNEGAVKKMMANKDSDDIYVSSLIGISKAFGCHPCEFLPESLGSYSKDLNEEVLKDVLKSAIKIYIEIENTSIDWLLDLIVLAYKKYSTNTNHKEYDNDNDIYEWMQDRVEWR